MSRLLWSWSRSETKEYHLEGYWRWWSWLFGIEWQRHTSHDHILGLQLGPLALYLEIDHEDWAHYKSKETPDITPKEALLRLAGLEKDCNSCFGKGYTIVYGPSTDPKPANTCPDCHGTGNVHVLDLREPCPRGKYGKYGDIKTALYCDNCQSRGWVPKEGKDALYHAWVKTGGSYVIWSPSKIGGLQCGMTLFRIGATEEFEGKDPDPHIAAMKAMMAAGDI